jgi:hypothetical protein
MASGTHGYVAARKWSVIRPLCSLAVRRHTYERFLVDDGAVKIAVTPGLRLVSTNLADPGAGQSGRRGHCR